MTEEVLAERLPPAYATALRLRAGGDDDATIAAVLGIEPEGVGPLLAVAAAKLQRLARTPGCRAGPPV